MNNPKIEFVDERSTGHWELGTGNPAEDSWFIATEEFARGGRRTDSRPFRSTKRWLAERLWQSKQIAKTSATADFEAAVLHIRPCDKATYFWHPDQFSQHFYYKQFPDFTKEIILDLAEAQLIELRDAIYKAARFNHAPTGIVLTYDDDYNALYWAAQKSDSFYEKYCRSKNLI